MTTNFYLCLSALTGLEELMKQQREEEGMKLVKTASGFLPLSHIIINKSACP